MRLLIILFLISVNSVYAAQKMVTCSLQGEIDNIVFTRSSKKNDLPKIDFPYPVTTIIFSLRPNNLLLVAIDSEELSRPRLFLSAQYNKNSHTYEGQFMTDYGGNQKQLDNGHLSCQAN